MHVAGGSRSCGLFALSSIHTSIFDPLILSVFSFASQVMQQNRVLDAVSLAKEHIFPYTRCPDDLVR